MYFLNYLGNATWLEGIIGKWISNIIYIIKHRRWKVHRYINQIKQRYNPNTKERVEQPMSVIYEMFEVPGPQQYNQIVRANENVHRREL